MLSASSSVLISQGVAEVGWSEGSVTRVVNLGHPGAVVEVAENVRVVPGDLLVPAEEEAAAGAVVLLQHPAVGAVVGVLGRA